MIAPGSFPVIRAEAIVNMNLLRLLTRNGEFEIDLVSRRLNHPLYPSDELPHYGIKLKSLSVIGFKGLSNLSIPWFILKSFITFGVCFRSCHWAAKALRVVEQKAKANEYDYVLTKSAPSFLLGWYLRKKYGLKWVASWNDPYPASKFPPPYGKGADFKGALMDKAAISRMRCADVHIFPSERLMHYMQRYLNANPSKCIVIAHASAFHSAGRQRKCDGTLRMIHLGNLLPPRSPIPLLKALASLRRKFPEKKIVFTLMGRFDESVEKIIEKNELAECVSVCSPVEYRKSLELLASHDVAVIIEAPVEEGIFLPTKVGDYSNMGMPVLAISPKVGMLNDLYKEGVIGYFSAVSDTDGIEKEIGKIYDDYCRNTLKIAQAEIPYSSPSYITKQYERL